MAVVPFDALAQAERQFGAVLVPRPIGGQIWDDRLQAVLRYVLLVEDEIVEDTHHRDLGRVGRLFEDRHAGRTVAVVDFQNAASLLGENRSGARNGGEQRTDHCECAQTSRHLHVLPCSFRPSLMGSGDDRMGPLLPLGPLAARTVVCKLSRIRLSRQGRYAHIAMASMGGKAWAIGSKTRWLWFREQDRPAWGGATARRRRCSSPAREQRSSPPTSTSMPPSRPNGSSRARGASAWR